MTEFTPEQVDRLKAALAEIQDSPTYGSFYAKRLKVAIDSIGEAPSHETLFEICNLAALGYPEGELNDATILNNEATPLLMTYLLNAFRSYRDQIDQAETKPDSTKRGEFLQLAFGGRGGKRGGNTRAKLWDETRKMAVYGVFSKHFHASHRNGLTTENAWLAGFDAAYEYAFNSDTLGGRDPKQIQKNRAKLEALMDEHQPRSTIFK